MTLHEADHDPRQAEFDATLDAWVKDANARVGEMHYPHRGLLPPDPKVAYHSAWNNEYITPDLIRHYADAIGDLNPLWRSPEYAERSRHARLMALPTIIDCVSITARHDRTTIPKGVISAIAGADRRWFAPIGAGDRLKVIDRYLGIEEKSRPAGGGRLFLERYERSYVRVGSGEVVAIAIAPCIHRASLNQQDAPGRWEPYRYTEAELEAIWQANENEFRRGMETLFWESVDVGEQVPTIVAGPLSSTDVWVYLATLGYQAAFGVRERIQRDCPDWTRRNLITNAPEMGDLIHITRDNPYQSDPFGSAGQSEGLLARMLCNWMGDEGFLMRLACKARRPNWIGDTGTFSAQVTAKRQEGDGHLVDLVVAGHNQRGVRFIEGEATVRLLSRTSRG